MSMFQLYDISDMDDGTQMRLGRVFISEDANRFLNAMTNGDGSYQLTQSIRAHAQVGGTSKHPVGDVLCFETDEAGRTHVWLQSEEEPCFELGYWEE